MSDFLHDFWSSYISITFIVGVLACLLLLWVTSSIQVKGDVKDQTTGHVWDEDLTELNNPLPKWWMYLFVITIVFGLVYVFLYPALGSNAGFLKWTSVEQHQAEVQKTQKALTPIFASYQAMSIPEVANQKPAMEMGERLFLNNCAQCHGADARGSKGFPNLTDADWLYGGSPEKIKESIHDGRNGQMPAMAAAVGTAEEARNLSHYVLSLSGSPHNDIQAALGKSKFSACAACHGLDGKGNQAIGAPNLSDDVWLHGWGSQAILNMIQNGKTNQMPAQKDKLSEGQIHVLTAYVWSLSHTKPDVAKK